MDHIVTSEQLKNLLLLYFNFIFYSFQTSNGITKEEIGEVKKPAGGVEESLAVAGHYSYVGDDGRTYNVNYRADENGFQPYGEDDFVEEVKPRLLKNVIASLING